MKRVFNVVWSTVGGILLAIGIILGISETNDIHLFFVKFLIAAVLCIVGFLMITTEYE